jgi:WD40 repeat protein
MYSANLSPDENRVLLVCERGSILYGVTDRSQRMLPAMQGFRGWFQDGKNVMLENYEGGNGTSVVKWKTMDIDTGTITPCWEEPYSWDAPSHSFSSLGQFADVTDEGEDKQTLKICDARTHATLREFKDLGGLSRYPIWIKDGRRLFLVSPDHKEARVIDAEAGAVQFTLSREGHCFECYALWEDESGAAWAFSKDAANHRYAWKLAADGAPRKVLDGSRIAPATFFFDRAVRGRLVTMNMEEDRLWVYAVYSLDGMNKLAEWRCRTNRQLYGGFTANKALTHAVASFQTKRDDYGSPQSMSFALCTKDSETPVRSGPGKFLAISPDGRYLVLQTDERLACLYNAQTDRIVGQYAPPPAKDEGRHYISMSAAFSDDGKRMALNNSEFVEVTDLSENYPRRTMNSGNSRFWWVTPCFSPDASRLLCGGDSCAWLFDAASGALLHTFEETERFADLYQYRNGGFWNSLANMAKDWAGMVTNQFKGGNQLDAVFAEGGSRVITQMAGQIIRVWDTGTGKLLQTIHTYLPEKRNARGEIRNAVTFSANGRFAFGCNADNFGPAGLWSLSDGSLLRKYRLPESTWLSGAPQDDGKALFIMSGGDLYRWAGSN